MVGRLQIHRCLAVTQNRRRCKIQTKTNRLCTKHQLPMLPKWIGHVLYDQLFVIDFIFRKHDIPYVVVYGSLLGCVRHGGIMTHDDDNDIVVFEQYRHSVANLVQEFREKGFLLSVTCIKESFALTNIWLPGHHIESPSTDIYFMDIDPSNNSFLQTTCSNTFGWSENERKMNYITRHNIERLHLGSPILRFSIPVSDKREHDLDLWYPGWKTRLVFDKGSLHMNCTMNMNFLNKYVCIDTDRVTLNRYLPKHVPLDDSKQTLRDGFSIFQSTDEYF